MSVPLRKVVFGPVRRRSVLWTHRPAVSAVGLVACCWAGEPGWDRQLRVLPDGRVDVVWTGERLMAVWAGAAPLRISVTVSSPSVGVRLHPGAGATVLGPALWDCAGQPVPVAEVVQGPAVAVATRLEQQLADMADPEQVRRVLQRGVVALAGDRRPDRCVETAARLLTDPGARAARVAQLVGWSQRTLRRRVRAETGLGPKELARVARFQGILARLGQVAAGGESLAEAAASAGYADQAHLGHECQRLAASTPAGLVAAWRRAVDGRNLPDRGWASRAC
jgi:methylphosphotriester-DNA--protein-cysteine methyltransferase